MNKDRSNQPQSVQAQTASLLRVHEASKELAVSVRSVWRLVSAGTLDKVRIGRSVRITRDSISRFIEQGGEQ